MNPTNPQPGQVYTQPTPQPQPATPSQDNTIQNLMTQVSQLEKSLTDMQGFVEDTSTVIAAMMQNPGVRSALGLDGGTPAPQPQPTPQPAPTPQPTPAPTNTPAPAPAPTPQSYQDPRVASLDASERQRIVLEVERQLGYTNLTEDQRRDLRGKVQKKLAEWNHGILQTPVHQLPEILKDAYTTVDLRPALEQGRLEALVQAHGNELGMFPAMNTATPTTDENQLTPGHIEMAKRYDIDPDKVQRRIQQMKENGGVMTYEPPQQTATPQPQAPSGTPVPPAAPQQ